MNILKFHASILCILQVENEYGFYEAAYGEGGKRYALWAAKMALSQNTGVPWIMCEQFDAPIEVVSTCCTPASMLQFLANIIVSLFGCNSKYFYYLQFICIRVYSFTSQILLSINITI